MLRPFRECSQTPLKVNSRLYTPFTTREIPRLLGPVSAKRFKKVRKVAPSRVDIPVPLRISRFAKPSVLSVLSKIVG